MATWTDLVQAAALSDRFLSAEYHSPHYRALEQKLRQATRCVPLSSLAKSLFQGWSPSGGVKGESGVPAIKTKNLSCCTVSYEMDCAEVPDGAVPDRAWAVPGDIYVLRCAHHPRYIGKDIGRFDGHHLSKPFITEKIIVARDVGASANDAYVTAFLQTDFGYQQIQRRLGGLTANYTPDDFGSVLVPVPDSRVQEFIGSKIELAERCRGRAGVLRGEAVARFDDLLKLRVFRPGNKLTNVIEASALSDRLSGEFYLPRYFALEAHLASLTVPVRPLRALLRCDVIRSSTPERSDDAAVPCILTSDIDPHEIRWRSPSLRVTQSVHDGHSGGLAPRDVVYTSVGPPVGEAAVVLPQFLPMAAGGDVSILRSGADLHPGFLALYLNSVFGQMQNDRYSRGIRQRRVYPEDIGAFLIPVFSPKEQAYIGERIVRHQVLNELAVDYLNEAKADVEALIAGKLDTEAIIAGRLAAPSARDISELAKEGA